MEDNKFYISNTGVNEINQRVDHSGSLLHPCAAPFDIKSKMTRLPPKSILKQDSRKIR